MSSFEWNKIIASVLTAMIVAMVPGILAQGVVHPIRSKSRPICRRRRGRAGPRRPPAPSRRRPRPIRSPPLAKADANHGQQVAKVCLQCHTFDKGEAEQDRPQSVRRRRREHRQVPANVLRRAAGATRARSGIPDELNDWLYNPQQFAKGTKMTFAGLPKAQDRADVIAYLQTLK